MGQLKADAAKASCHQWRAWQRRAETLHRNIGALQSDMIEQLGEGHDATDFSDNVMCETEALCSVLSRLAEASKRRTNPDAH